MQIPAPTLSLNTNLPLQDEAERALPAAHSLRRRYLFAYEVQVLLKVRSIPVWRCSSQHHQASSFLFRALVRRRRYGPTADSFQGLEAAYSRQELFARETCGCSRSRP